MQSDGKILVGGEFTQFNRIIRGCLARLNADGSLDMSFNPKTGVDGWIGVILPQDNGQVLIAGDFNKYE